MSAPLIFILAGGTGGHVYPALAVAEELLARGFRVEWVGTRRGLEGRVAPAAGFTLHHLPVRGLRGKGGLDTLRGVLALFASLWLAAWLVLRRAPACVVGLGGYAAGPVGLVARLLGRPLVVHEQNAVAGTTNRLLAPIASARLAGFPDAFPARRPGEFVGNPVRRALLETARASQWYYDGTRPARLLVLGGSLGARPINRLLPDCLDALEADGMAPMPEVWHQCGADHLDTVRAAYAASGRSDVRCDAFIEDMAAAYAWADVVLCRAGALTVAELAIMSRPALLVPLPQAIDDHQTHNARFLADRGAALLLRQAGLSGAAIAKSLAALLRQPERLHAMSRAAAGCAMPAATQAVADRCEALLT
jgi:UDP-N-acetylglucosamine--N-acetylmuramyl-(pentapeptide) pyrophosphoryl-undecaprenol N-acetylglucosamine transferase